MKEVSGRVWTGERLERADKRISKLRTGEIGERIAAHVLSQQHDAQIVTLNEGINNAPIDLAGDHIAAEVKTGLASNGKSAQHWRATIGQPGPAERELLDGMSASEKRDYNNWKVVEILNRKYNTLALMGEQVGAEIRPVTVGIILHPNGNRGDVFLIPDFHSYLSWTQFATDEYYTGTYEIES